MSSATFYVSSSGDDGTWYGASTFDNSGDYLQIGFRSGYPDSFFVRINNLNIKKGSTVSSCTLSLRLNATQTGAVVSSKIYAESSDSPSAPTSHTQCASLPLTTSYVDWLFSNTVYGQDCTSPDVSSILQEVVDRPGWVSGNSIVFVVKGNSNSGTNNYTTAFSVNSVPPALNVVWTEPATNDVSGSIASLSSFGIMGVFGESIFPALSMDVFPLAMSGAVVDISIPAFQSLQLGGEALIPVMEMAATGYEYVAGAGGVGSMSLRINNDGLGGISCSVTSAAIGSMSVLSATMSATAMPGNDGVMTFPVATMTGRVGSRGEADLPLATVASWTTNPGDGVMVMRQATMAAFVYHAGLIASGAMKMPKAKVAGHALVGQVGRAALGVRVGMAAHGISGQLAHAAVRMVPATATGVASINLHGTAATAMYQPTVEGSAIANSSEFTGPVVYEKEATR